MCETRRVKRCDSLNQFKESLKDIVNVLEIDSENEWNDTNSSEKYSTFKEKMSF